ncbi:MAG TPA: PadR family transcriptional regulator [Actinobacteria bacterium]|nr:PadR family transcriptional regulator [Actinomycetota bacterium]
MKEPPYQDARVGLPRNFIQACLLVLIAERPSHGYDLMERLSELGLPRPDPGSLYRTLRGLERDRLVTSAWVDSASGPPRRTYRLSDEGRDWLHVLAGAHRETRKILDRFLERYEGLEHELDELSASPPVEGELP